MTSDSIELTRLYHERYLRAINSPLRRKILRVLKEGPTSIEELLSKTGLENGALKWHLDMLEHGFCVENLYLTNQPTFQFINDFAENENTESLQVLNSVCPFIGN